MVIALLIYHFLCDWIFQSRSMAVNKSKKLSVLNNHLAIIYSGLIITFLIIGYKPDDVGFRILLNTILHGIIDWYIWRVYRWMDRKFHWDDSIPYYERYSFFTFIAIDQFLHLSILFLLFA